MDLILMERGSTGSVPNGSRGWPGQQSPRKRCTASRRIPRSFRRISQRPSHHYTDGISWQASNT